MKKTFLFLAAALTALASCGPDEPETPPDDTKPGEEVTPGDDNKDPEDDPNKDPEEGDKTVLEKTIVFTPEQLEAALGLDAPAQGALAGVVSNAIDTKSAALAWDGTAWKTSAPVAVSQDGELDFYITLPYIEGALIENSKIGIKPEGAANLQNARELPEDQGDGSSWKTFSAWAVADGMTVTVAKTDETVALGGSLSNLFAAVKFQLRNSGKALANVSRITLAATGSSAKLTGAYCYPIKGQGATPRMSASAALVHKSATLSGLDIAPAAEYGDETGVLLVCPGSYSGVSVTIILSDEKTLTLSLGEETLSLASNEFRTLQFDLADFEGAGGDEPEPEVPGIASAADWEAFAAAMNVEQLDVESLSRWTEQDGDKVIVPILESFSAADLSRIQAFPENFVLDGRGNTITRTALTTPLFQYMNGTVRNLTLAGAAGTIEDAVSVGAATLARANNGHITDVTSSVSMNLSFAGNFLVSGLVVCNGGEMTRCHNTGSITLNVSTEAADRTGYVGGIAAIGSGSSNAGAGECGNFTSCTNTGDIIMNVNPGDSKSVLKHAQGGICGFVHNGTAEKFTTISQCTNSGKIARYDNAPLGKNGAAALGGIIGRVCTNTGNAYIIDTQHTGYYIEIRNCTNSGTIDNGAYFTGGSALKSDGYTQTGARMGHVGGIAGTIYSYNTTQSVVSGCTNTGTLRGGHDKESSCFGGIVGYISNVKIENCKASFTIADTENPLSTSMLNSIMGGITGYVRYDSEIASCEAKVNASGLASCTMGGLLVGMVYYEKADAMSQATISGTCKAGGTVCRGTEHIAATAENIDPAAEGHLLCNKYADGMFITTGATITLAE